ncbi:DMT family transporter [Aestuariivita sp.]|jgi:drug/metabolite transporter (DMT)-like permease|uniref:DMT family transporter n=1 Tax=Aestuariivita sp. TaxID=1872407 RepID=UPI00216E9459|nr:DMT family transporter [Aestuariivita sp.]MCE8009435.1 DMT family transporter [Aestuariivita sp.]
MLHTAATKPLSAALFMVGAMLIIGGIDNVIVLVAQEIGLWQFHFTRALTALPMVIVLSLIGLGTLWPRRWWAVALRSGLVALSMLFYFSALALMPIAQALAGLFTSPIFILIITVLVLGQPIGRWRILAVALGFLGILMVLQVDPRTFSWLTVLPVAGGFFYALGAISTRTFCAGESTVSMLAGLLVMLGSLGALGLLTLHLWPMESAAGPAGFVTRGWVWPMPQASPFVLLQAVGSVAGVFMIIKAYQLGEPSYVAVFEYSVMIFGPLYAFVLFGQTLSIGQLAGIALIMLAGMVIALRAR